jgi:hypothetical protein
MLGPIEAAPSEKNLALSIWAVEGLAQDQKSQGPGGHARCRWNLLTPLYLARLIVTQVGAIYVDIGVIVRNQNARSLLHFLWDHPPDLASSGCWA